MIKKFSFIFLWILFELYIVNVQYSVGNGYYLDGVFDLLKKGDGTAAIVELDLLLEKDQGNVQLYKIKGFVFYKMANYALAITEYSKAIGLDENDPEIYFRRGMCFREIGFINAAIDDFSKAIQVERRFVQAYLSKGELLSRSGKYDEAIADFSQFIDFVGDNFFPYLLRGNVYSEIGDYESAKNDYDKALSISPGNSMVLAFRAELFAKYGKYANAILDYRKAIQLSPSYERPLRGLSWLLATSKEEKFRNGHESLSLAYQALDIFSKDKKIDRHMAHFYFATIAAAYAEIGLYDQAIKYQTKAYETLDSNTDFSLIEEYSQRLDSFVSNNPLRK